jgi:hypothetical protein
MPSYEEVEGLEPIGRGGFAEVRFCFRSDDGAPFAKKILIQEDDDSQRRFRREVEILHLLAGPKIMPIVDADLDVRPPFYTDSESVAFFRVWNLHAVNRRVVGSKSHRRSQPCVGAKTTRFSCAVPRSVGDPLACGSELSSLEIGVGDGN